jgi:hypothetical protein
LLYFFGVVSRRTSSCWLAAALHTLDATSTAPGASTATALLMRGGYAHAPPARLRLECPTGTGTDSHFFLRFFLSFALFPYLSPSSSLPSSLLPLTSRKASILIYSSAHKPHRPRAPHPPAVGTTAHHHGGRSSAFSQLPGCGAFYLGGAPRARVSLYPRPRSRQRPSKLADPELPPRPPCAPAREQPTRGADWDRAVSPRGAGARAAFAVVARVSPFFGRVRLVGRRRAGESGW